ncbi:MAG: hypothetical protein Q4C95_02855 [Planctomycetia bacterium]|nr:hypothetical protein [Planctomycetia bacterium]
MNKTQKTIKRLSKSVFPVIFLTGICFPVLLYYSFFAFSQEEKRSFFENNNVFFNSDTQKKNKSFFQTKRPFFSDKNQGWNFQQSFKKRLNERFNDSMDISLNCQSSSEQSMFFPVVQFNSDSPAPLTREESPWGKFQPGSWILLQKVDLTPQNNKIQKSVKEIRQTLISVEDDGYTLKEETRILMGTTWFDNGFIINKYDFWGNLILSDSAIIESPVVFDVSQSNLCISSEMVPCLVRKTKRLTPQCKEMTTIWYSTVKSPFILQKEVKTYSLPTEQNPEEQLINDSLMRVLNTSGRLTLWNNQHSFRSQTESRNENGTTITKTNHQSNIPGGILRSISTETDKKGQMLYQSQTRVLSYYVHSF